MEPKATAPLLPLCSLGLSVRVLFFSFLTCDMRRLKSIYLLGQLCSFMIQRCYMSTPVMGIPAT